MYEKYSDMMDEAGKAYILWFSNEIHKTNKAWELILWGAKLYKKCALSSLNPAKETAFWPVPTWIWILFPLLKHMP